MRAVVDGVDAVFRKLNVNRVRCREVDALLEVLAGLKTGLDHVKRHPPEDRRPPGPDIPMASLRASAELGGGVRLGVSDPLGSREILADPLGADSLGADPVDIDPSDPNDPGDPDDRSDA